MGNLVPYSRWDDVPYFEANAVLTGGPDCPDNLPIQALLNRTEYLKGMVENMSLGFDAVPATNKGLFIVVKQPHLRMMMWDGSQYVRAPWHQPCELFFSYDNPASIPGALPVRADVSYQQSNYPDVVQRLGLSGSGTFTLVEARGEFVRVLDNGRGVDVGRANQSAQAASRWGLISHIDGTYPSGWHDKLNQMYLSWEDRMQTINTGGSAGNFGGLSGMENTFPHLWREGALRPRNVAFPLWMTI